MAQDAANKFVLEHFATTYKDPARHLHISASLALAGLESAYINECMTSTPDGRLVPNVIFSLAQVYKGYYSTLAAEYAISYA